MTNEVQAPPGLPEPTPVPAAFAPPMPPAPTHVPSTQRADAVPPAAYLSADGIAGTELIVYDLNKQSPYIVLDGQRLKKNMNNVVKVPMADGSTGKIKISAFIPGRPTIRLKDKVLYKAPKAPALDVFAFTVATVGVGLFAGGWFGGIAAAVGAFGAGIGGAAWLRTAQSKSAPRTVLIAGGILAAALGVVGFWITFQALK